MDIKVTQTAVTDPLLKDAECCEIIGCSVPTWWRWVREGRAPKPVKLGKLSRWPRSEIFGLIESAKAARNAA